VIAIRPYQHEDAGRLAALFRAAVRSLASRDYPAAQIHAWVAAIQDTEQFARRCAAKMTWVAVCESQIAGFSDLEPDGHIDMLYVDPELARRGIARALLAHVESTAAESGIRRLYTEASITARPVFERAGFVVIAEQIVTLGGEAIRNFRMERRLETPR
jgi:putative acetyltransferase